MSDERKIGLFMDFENIVRGIEGGKSRTPEEGGLDVHLILGRLLEQGTLVVKRAYCDWARYKNFKQSLHEAAFELIDIPKRRVSGKNSADIRMVVDVMDFASTKPHVDTYCLVTGDSDFSPLVSKLRENNRSVIGVGVRETVSPLLADNCDDFIYYENLVKDKELRRRKSVNVDKLDKNDQEAFDLVTDAAAALHRDGRDLLWASMVKQTIKRKHPQFSEAAYDYGSFSELLEEMEKHEVLQLERDKKSGSYLVELLNS
ncbi:MAG: hypothetical protein CMJ85_01985 [Planctomycetes bacterium]|nr:hypothetical protein [Planctomycetota bacterium]